MLNAMDSCLYVSHSLQQPIHESLQDVLVHQDFPESLLVLQDAICPEQDTSFKKEWDRSTVILILSGPIVDSSPFLFVFLSVSANCL